MRYLAMLLLLAACEPKTPHWRRWCTKEHIEQHIVFMPMSNGKTTTLTPIIQYWPVCDARDSAYVQWDSVAGTWVLAPREVP